MVIKLKGTQLELTPAIEQYVRQKLDSVRRLIVRIDASNVAEADVEIERTTRHHRRGLVYRAEINLALPKELLRAEALSEDIRLAVNEATEELRRQIKKYKAKLETQFRQARKINT
ncbi:MAG: ribosomal subunit interface protein [Parcubacteria group bacterium RIFCSPLOWO2_01_FULL_48_18]|nr:MAG: ribosomal subunit interface protein [Parcubacteria group bacterium RIFCSPHIGHO2_02_FULL_48_10b]OHB23422.1 MAG: ribosomal subunit interface protein [Parcubacteria group bacterium RIFCSPLOWO2_01_FULL_48_18]